MTIKSYDSIPENEGILLDLPFVEGTGTILNDVAKSHHLVEISNSGGGTCSWDTLASGLNILDFEPDGTKGYYLEGDSSETADLNFTSGDYSFGIWMKQESSAVASEILAGKYTLNSSGWEIYTTFTGSAYLLSVRHHHSLLTPQRSAGYSAGWIYDNWWFAGISRSGNSISMYRNGVEVDVITGEGGLQDPESSAGDNLIIGARYTKNSDFIIGKYWRPRIWNRVVSASEWQNMFERERGLLGI